MNSSICKFNVNYNNVIIKSHDSSSKSIVIFSKDNKKKYKITLKLFLDTTKRKNSNDIKLYTESKIYERIDKLMGNNYHVVDFIERGMCDYNDYINSLYLSDIKDKNSIERSLNRITDKYTKTKYIYYTAYKYVNGKPLDDIIYYMNDMEISKILFSIIHTLLEFQKNYIMHNDLHLGNILVKETDKKRIYKYKVNNYSKEYKYSFTSSKCPIIYDFDHATIIKGSKNNIYNPAMDYSGWLCKRHYRCNIFRKKKDLYKVLAVMAYKLREHRHPLTVDFIRRCIGKLSYAVSNFSVMDTYKKNTFDYRLQNTISLEEALMDKYFLHLRDS